MNLFVFSQILTGIFLVVQYVFIVHGISSIVALLFMISCVPDDIAKSSSTKCTSQKNQEKKVHVSQSGGDWKDGMRVLFSDVQILSLFSLIAVTGYSMGFLENFCYISIRQLYKTHGQEDFAGRDITLCRVFYSIGGVVCWFYSGAMQSYMGPNTVMFASVCCLPLCFFLYAGVGLDLDIVTKVGIFLAEALRSGIFAVLWSTATIRLSNLSPPHMTAMMVSRIIPAR